METRIERIERYIEEFTRGMLDLKESQNKTDAQQNRTDAQILGLREYHRQTEELLQKTIKEFRATQKSLGDLGLVQGEVAEELFYRNVKGLFGPPSASMTMMKMIESLPEPAQERARKAYRLWADVLLDDGHERKKIHLDRGYHGLYVPTMIWRELENFSSGGICLVLASAPYDEKDYIRDYQEFLSLVKTSAQGVKES